MSETLAEQVAELRRHVATVNRNHLLLLRRSKPREARENRELRAYERRRRLAGATKRTLSWTLANPFEVALGLLAIAATAVLMITP